MPTLADTKHDIREMPEIRERVSVWMNLNSGSIIVKRRSSDHGEYGETLLQTPKCIVLADVDFRVQDASHEKVVDSGSRDVCAYAVGLYVGMSGPDGYVPAGDLMDRNEARTVAYNPFRSKHFHIPGTEERDLIPVDTAEKLFIWSEQTEDGPKGRMRAYRPSFKFT
jgi:hypothetical protein